MSTDHSATPSETNCTDNWSDPGVDSLDVRITQGAMKADVTAVDGEGMSCEADVETLFGPRIRFIVDGFDATTDAHVHIDLHLDEREELLQLAHCIITEYGEATGASAAPDPGSTSITSLSPTD